MVSILKYRGMTRYRYRTFKVSTDNRMVQTMTSSHTAVLVLSSSSSNDLFSSSDSDNENDAKCGRAVEQALGRDH